MTALSPLDRRSPFLVIRAISALYSPRLKALLQAADGCIIATAVRYSTLKLEAEPKRGTNKRASLPQRVVHTSVPL